MRVVLVALLTLVLLVAGSTGAQAKTRTDRVIKDSRIAESSGLAPSLLHDNVLWTHNDSGNSNRIYAVAQDGSTAAAVVVAGEDARDWEAITSFELNGTAYLAIGDIGDNEAKHDSVRIAIIEEPQALTDTTVTPVRVLRLTYPGGARDAEALLSDPSTGQLYVVSKTLFGSEVYAVPTKLWPGVTSGTSAVTKMKKIADTGVALVTDGSFLPTGNILLRGYGNMAVVAGPDQVDNGSLETLASKALPDQEQGESLAVVDDGAYALIGSEGENSPVLRVRIPQVASTAEATSETTPAQTSTSQNASEAAQKLRDLAGGSDNLKRLVVIGAGAVSLILLACIAMMLRPRRSRRRRR